MIQERFFRLLFRSAAAYNLLVGTFVIFFPQTFFHFFQLEEINHSFVMSGLGMFVAVYGYGFYLVSTDLRRHVPFALLGLAGKSFGVAGWIFFTVMDEIPLSALWLNFFNDVLWIPFLVAYLRWRRRVAAAETFIS